MNADITVNQIIVMAMASIAALVVIYVLIKVTKFIASSLSLQAILSMLLMICPIAAYLSPEINLSAELAISLEIIGGILLAFTAIAAAGRYNRKLNGAA